MNERYRKIFKSSKAVGLFASKSTLRFWTHAVIPFPIFLAKQAVRHKSLAMMPASMGEAVTQLLSHSGPAFIKLGQILATRQDLFHPSFCEELETLYSSQKPMPYSEVQRVLRELHTENSFAHIEKKALGTGSIGQVHRAHLHDGRKVIIKIARDRIDEQLRDDFKIINNFLEGLKAWPWAYRRMGEHNFFTLRRAIEELEKQMLLEVDFLNEAQNIATFSARFQNSKRVKVPTVFLNLCNRRILVMEELEGETLASLRKRAKEDPEAAQKVATLALEEILRQVFEDGTFHADPHGGNLLIMPDGRLGLIDLGLTGELSNDDRRKIAALIRAFVKKDASQIIEVLLAFGEQSERADIEKIKSEVIELISKNKSNLINRAHGKIAAQDKASSLESFVSDLFQIAARNGIYIPSSTALLIKTFVTIEGVARGLNPELNLVKTAVPVILKSLSKNWLNKFAFWKD